MKPLLLLVQLLLFCLLAIGQSDTVKPASNQAVFQLLPSAHFEPAQKRYAFDTIMMGTPGKFNIRFTNTGNTPLIISVVKTSCGCMVSTWPREPILTGEIGEFSVALLTNGRPGNLHKTMTVIHNGASHRDIIRFVGYIKRPKE